MEVCPGSTLKTRKNVIQSVGFEFLVFEQTPLTTFSVYPEVIWSKCQSVHADHITVTHVLEYEASKRCKYSIVIIKYKMLYIEEMKKVQQKIFYI